MENKYPWFYEIHIHNLVCLIDGHTLCSDTCRKYSCDYNKSHCVTCQSVFRKDDQNYDKGNVHIRSHNKVVDEKGPGDGI